MTEPNTDFLGENVKLIKLAGKEWPIPLLAPRQQRVIVPALNKLFRGISRTTREDFELSTELIDLLTDVIWVALTRAHPQMKRDELLDMDTNISEMVDAMYVVSDQTRLYKRKVKEPNAAGEAKESQSTGTA